MVIPYEPLWAIGTGQGATPEETQEMAAAIRGIAGEIAGQAAAATLRIQYGGSVTPDNAASMLAQPDVDGALIGGASLDPDRFAETAGVIARAGVPPAR